MKYVRLGSTGLQVSKLGLGCGGPSRLGFCLNKIQWGDMYKNALEIIQTAIEHGINYIDTAPSYGTEEIVGAVLKSRRYRRDQLVICTKTYHRLNIRAGWKTLVERTIKNLDNSLKALNTDYIDVFMLHAPQTGAYQRAYEMLREPLQNQIKKGKIRFLGVSEDWPIDKDHKMLLQTFHHRWDVAMYGLANPYYLAEMPRGTIAMATNRESRSAKTYSQASHFADVILCGTGNVKHLLENIRRFE